MQLGRKREWRQCFPTCLKGSPLAATFLAKGGFMPIRKFRGSASDGIAYAGTTQYYCPICEKVFTTEKIEVQCVSEREAWQSQLYNTPVLRLALVEKPAGQRLELEIDYVCQKCKVPIKLVRELEE